MDILRRVALEPKNISPRHIVPGTHQNEADRFVERMMGGEMTPTSGSAAASKQMPEEEIARLVAEDEHREANGYGPGELEHERQAKGPFDQGLSEAERQQHVGRAPRPDGSDPQAGAVQDRTALNEHLAEEARRNGGFIDEDVQLSRAPRREYTPPLRERFTAWLREMFSRKPEAVSGPDLGPELRTTAGETPAAEATADAAQAERVMAGEAIANRRSAGLLIALVLLVACVVGFAVIGLIKPKQDVSAGAVTTASPATSSVITAVDVERQISTGLEPVKNTLNGLIQKVDSVVSLLVSKQVDDRKIAEDLSNVAGRVSTLENRPLPTMDISGVGEKVADQLRRDLLPVTPLPESLRKR